MREVPEVGMAVTIDVGHPTNVHPIMKQTIGQKKDRNFQVISKIIVPKPFIF